MSYVGLRLVLYLNPRSTCHAEYCGLLSCGAVKSCMWLPTFRRNVSLPSSRLLYDNPYLWNTKAQSIRTNLNSAGIYWSKSPKPDLIEICLAVSETRHEDWRTDTTSLCIHSSTSCNERVKIASSVLAHLCAYIEPVTLHHGSRLQHSLLRTNAVWTLPALYTIQLTPVADTAWHLTGHAWPLTWDENVKSMESVNNERGKKYTFS
jgi:hypothetical protein